MLCHTTLTRHLLPSIIISLEKKQLEVGYLSCRTFAWTASDFYHSVELHPLICNPKFQQGINTGTCMKVHNYCPTISPQCMNIFQSSINNTMNIAWVPPPFGTNMELQIESNLVHWNTRNFHWTKDVNGNPWQMVSNRLELDEFWLQLRWHFLD